MKGLLCSILENKEHGNCSNGGISSQVKRVVLINEGVEIFEVTDNMPAVWLVRRTIGGKPYIHAEPVKQPNGKCGPMFGGTYIVTSDSRFPSPYPIPLHDRFETAEENRAMSA